MTQTVKNLPEMWETQVWTLDQEDPLEKGMATCSSILAWRIPWTEEPGGLQSMGVTKSLTELKFTFITSQSLCRWLGEVVGWYNSTYPTYETLNDLHLFHKISIYLQKAETWHLYEISKECVTSLRVILKLELAKHFEQRSIFRISIKSAKRLLWRTTLTWSCDFFIVC